jgi:hypothetical protein
MPKKDAALARIRKYTPGVDKVGGNDGETGRIHALEGKQQKST